MSHCLRFLRVDLCEIRLSVASGADAVEWNIAAWTVSVEFAIRAAEGGVADYACLTEVYLFLEDFREDPAEVLRSRRIFDVERAGLTVVA